MTNYSVLSIEQVLYLHEKIIILAGGVQGVRDFALMHSALERAKATFGGEDLYPTITHKAAALMHSLVMNHCFLDGNKRTAWQVTKRFLYANGAELSYTQQEVIDFCLSVDNKGWAVPEIVIWLRSHSS